MVTSDNRQRATSPQTRGRLSARANAGHRGFDRHRFHPRLRPTIMCRSSSPRSRVDNPRRPGEVAWRDALKHQTENIGEKTAVEIQIELK